MRKPNSKRFLEESVDVLFTSHIPVFVEPLMECKEKIDLDEKLVVFLKVFVRISQVLYLTPAECQILLGLNTRSAKCWKYWVKKADAGKSFSHDRRNKFERLANLVSIYKLADALYGDGTGRGTRLWDRNGDPPFGGFSLLEHMLRGHFAQLFEVRQYLEPRVRATYNVRPDDGT
ncbi:MAG: hypothetical protein AAB920_01490 [Patescibacteria group bacterium]